MQQRKLKWYHWLISSIVGLICLLIIAGYGMSFLTTLLGQSGLNGTAYMYYNIGGFQFLLYNGIVLCSGVYSFCGVVFYVWKSDTTNLNKTFLRFLILFVFVIVCEVLLQMRFTGKG